MDTSIKNNVANSIAYIHVHNKPVIKTIHHAINVTTTEAKLFAIRYGINQTTGISRIVVITDSLHATQKIFDSSSYPFQIYSMSISNKLRNFFLQNQNNLIEFWECPSHCNWLLHKAINRKTKQFHPLPHYPYKSSWNYSMKSEYDDILSI